MQSNDENKEMNPENRGEYPRGPWDGKGWRCYGKRRMWKFPFIVLAIIAIKSALVLAFWNVLIPEVFHGPALNYLQAIELTVLAKLLVGFGGGVGPFGRFRHGYGPGGHHHFGRGRWAALTPEERQKLRDEMRSRCRRD